uniref:Uncharacterized protein n=1 Tax=Salix viminalis TaxID=40686 RepID=A0A6N2KRG8_SALVM
MASAATRVTFRVVVGILAILVLFYVGRPLYWKISATVQEIRENKRTVKQGISQIVFEAQKSVGWFHDESDSGVRQNRRLSSNGRKEGTSKALGVRLDPTCCDSIPQTQPHSSAVSIIYGLREILWLLLSFRSLDPPGKKRVVSL